MKKKKVKIPDLSKYEEIKGINCEGCIFYKKECNKLVNPNDINPAVWQPYWCKCELTYGYQLKKPQKEKATIAKVQEIELRDRITKLEAENNEQCTKIKELEDQLEDFKEKLDEERDLNRDLIEEHNVIINENKELKTIINYLESKLNLK